MQLDKSERFKHKYVLRKTTYNHIAIICIKWFPAYAVADESHDRAELRCRTEICRVRNFLFPDSQRCVIPYFFCSIIGKKYH